MQFIQEKTLYSASLNFLTDYECKKLIECINQSTRKSTLANDEDEEVTSDYRTSETADLHYFPTDLIFDIDNNNQMHHEYKNV